MNPSNEILFEVLNNNSSLRSLVKTVSYYHRLSKLPKSDKYRILLAALLRRNTNVTNILLEMDVPMSMQNSNEERANVPLHLATYPMENVKIVKVMLAKGAPVNAKNKLGETPLHLACKAVNSNLVNIFLRYKADVKIDTDAGKTPLYCLIEQCQYGKPVDQRKMEEITKILLGCGVDVNCTPAGCSPALLMSLLFGFYEVAKLLLENGTNVNVADNNMFTPLHHAVKRLNSDSIKMMLENGADPNAKAKNGSTPLIEACRCSNLEATVLLIEHGADVNCSMNLTTPLYFATVNRDVDLVALLLKAGADPHAIITDGTTPFFWARRLIEVLDDFDVVHCYFQNRTDTDIDSQDQRGNTILHMACIVNNFKAVKQLVELGASIKVKNKGGNEPLHYLDFAGEELKLMKTIKLNNYCSLYDLIFDENKMAAHANNEHLTAMLSSFKWKLQFSILDYVAIALYERGVARRNLLDLAQTKLQILIDHPIPDLCLQSILKHLCDKDLNTIVFSVD